MTLTAPAAPSTESVVDACARCVGLCATCPLDDGEWPPRDQTTIAATEADGLPYAGADAPTPHEAIAATWAAHARWRTRRRNQALYGAGGLFDNLDLSQPTQGDQQ